MFPTFLIRTNHHPQSHRSTKASQQVCFHLRYSRAGGVFVPVFSMSRFELHGRARYDSVRRKPTHTSFKQQKCVAELVRTTAVPSLRSQHRRPLEFVNIRQLLPDKKCIRYRPLLGSMSNPEFLPLSPVCREIKAFQTAHYSRNMIYYHSHKSPW